MSGDRLIRNTLAVTFSSGAAILIATPVTILIVLRYGLSHEADVYYLAVTLPRVLQNILFTTLPQLLIARLSEHERVHGEGSAEAFIMTLLTWAALMGAALYALAALLPSAVIAVMGPGLDSNSHALAVTVFRLTLIGLWLTPVTEILGAYLNYRGIFARAAGAEGIRSLLILAALVVFPASAGILPIAWAYFAGFVLQTMYVLGWSKRAGLRLRPSLRDDAKAVSSCMRDLALPLFGATLNFAPTALQRAFASLLAPGVVTAFALAQQIVGTLFSVGLRTVNVAGHPQVARLAVARDFDAMNRLLDRSLLLATASGITMAVYTAALVPDAIAAAVHGSALDAENGAFLNRLLLILICTLPLNGCVRVLRSPHYALNHPRVPGVQMALMGVSHMLLLYVLFRLYEAEGIASAQVLWVVLAVGLGFQWRPAQCEGMFRRNAPAMGFMIVAGIAATAAALAGRSYWLAWMPWDGYPALGLSALLSLAVVSIIALPPMWPVWHRVRAKPISL